VENQTAVSPSFPPPLGNRPGAIPTFPPRQRRFPLSEPKTNASRLAPFGAHRNAKKARRPPKERACRNHHRQGINYVFWVDFLWPVLRCPRGAATRSAIPEKRPSASTLFLLALAAPALYFCYLIASPFRAPIFLAVMIAIVFHPVHVRIQRHIRGKNAAALISTVLVVVVVIIPATALGVVVLKEIRGLAIC